MHLNIYLDGVRARDNEAHVADTTDDAEDEQVGKEGRGIELRGGLHKLNSLVEVEKRSKISKV